MEKENKIYMIGILIGIAFIIFIAFLDRPKDLEEEFVECLGNNSILYISTKCPHCQTQKDIFEDKLELLNIVDCSIEPGKCSEAGITNVPTWKFEKISLLGVHSISQLKNISGCYND